MDGAGSRSRRLLANLQYFNFMIGGNLNLDSLPHLLARKGAQGCSRYPGGGSKCAIREGRNIDLQFVPTRFVPEDDDDPFAFAIEPREPVDACSTGLLPGSQWEEALVEGRCF